MTLPELAARLEVQRDFPGVEPARFPFFRAGERTVSVLEPARVRELKTAYPGIVRTWVDARAAAGNPVSAADAAVADADATKAGWSSHWGQSAEAATADGGWASAADLVKA